MPFDPDKYLQETQTGFNPDKYLAETESQPKTQRGQDFLPFLANSAESVVGLATDAVNGAYNAVASPIETAKNIGQSIAGADMHGVGRAIRHIPLAGDAIENIGDSVRSLYALGTGGLEAEKQSRKDNQARRDALAAGDVQHAQEHPLTDFIQKAIGSLALPQGVVAQASMIAADAFNKTLSEGHDVKTALAEARNAAALVAMLQPHRWSTPSGTPIKDVIGKGIRKEFGVSDKAVQRFRERPDAVRAADRFVEDPVELQNMVAEKVNPIFATQESARAKLAESRSKVAETKFPPAGIAEDLRASLDDNARHISRMSGEAFDELIRMGEAFPADRLTDAITRAADRLTVDGVVPPFGEQAEAFTAMARFKAFVDEVAEKNHGYIPADRLKKFIQNLDDVSRAAYKKDAGAMSKGAAEHIKDLRTQVMDPILKESSIDPETGIPIPGGYAAKMAEFSPLTRIVGEMSKVFGDEKRAMQALSAISDPRSANGKIIRQMLAKYDKEAGTNLLPRVQDYFDSPRAEHAANQFGLAEANAKAKEVNLLNPGVLEKQLPAIGRGKSALAARQLENLDRDIYNHVMDTGAARDLSKSNPNGSRRAKAFGGLIGSAVGAIGGKDLQSFGIGTGAGAVIGALADTYGSQAVRTALSVGIKLDKLANSKYLGPIMKAAGESPQAAAVANYVLSQQPDYPK